MRRTERAPIAAAAAVAAALALTGCAGAAATPAASPTWVDLEAYDRESDGNGIALLSPADARAQVLSALAGFDGAMRVVFADAWGRALEARVSGTSHRFTADLTVDGETTTVIVDGSDAAVRPAASLAREAGIAAGEFACVASSDDLVTRWGTFLDPAALVAELTADVSGVGAPADGTIDLLLGEAGTSGVLQVNATGDALPVRLTRADDAGTVEAVFDGADSAEAKLPAGC